MCSVRPRRRVLRACAAGALGAALLPAATLAQAKRRIVSVGGALTEIVYALDAQADLVGVDTTSVYPEQAGRLPSVGYARALSPEGVLALAPTMLVASEEAGPPAVLRQISQAGVPVHVLAANHRFEGMIERVRRLGELLGREGRARTLAASLGAEWDRVRAEVAATRVGGGAMRTRSGLPLTLTWSPYWMRWPMCAGSLLTEMRPSRINCSISRREPSPACASTLCSLGVSACGSSTRLCTAGASLASSASKRPDTTSANW